MLTASLGTRRIGFPHPATKDVVLALRLRRRATAGVPRPVGAPSIALKLFLIVGTVGLFVWAGFLPEADAALSPTTRAVLDGIEVALNVVLATALAVFALAILTVIVAAIGWHATLPVAVAVVPFAVCIGAALGLWLMARGDFPGGG